MHYQRISAVVAKLLEAIGLWYSTVNFHRFNYIGSAQEPARETIKNMQIDLKSRTLAKQASLFNSLYMYSF